jgi:hypothetical protein
VTLCRAAPYSIALEAIVFAQVCEAFLPYILKYRLFHDYVK